MMTQPPLLSSLSSSPSSLSYLHLIVEGVPLPGTQGSELVLLFAAVVLSFFLFFYALFFFFAVSEEEGNIVPQ